MSNTDADDLANILKDIQIKNGWTHTQFAQVCEVKNNAYTQLWTRGKRCPKLPQLRNLLKYLRLNSPESHKILKDFLMKYLDGE